MKEKAIYIKNFENHHSTYRMILSDYRSELGWFFDLGGKEVHTVPFILTVAAALECSLNDHIIMYFSNRYEKEQADAMMNGFLSMNFKGKLLNIIPLLTGNEFTINTKSKTYQKLVKLITLRNSLVHNKSNYEIHEAFIKEDSEGNPYIQLQNDYQEKLDEDVDYSMGIEGDIGEFHDALESMHELFLDKVSAKEYSENKLVIPLIVDEIQTMEIVKDSEPNNQINNGH